ncbi:uncharacterized protein LOC110039109 [Phalaenopsis equestris]|uniref:uncharacterized protein LOC110039109 n=1 Tax=Phalaenopsis equestris TaxID=78828 RepID=UPI0009E3D9BE|nr:uncharacterized protein LOC110039109 [Phalaenopsis equestris]
MGACFSRSKVRRHLPSGFAQGCRDPPPEPEAPQEEAVKEVLSETPRLKASRPSKVDDIGIKKEGGNEIGRDDRSEGTSEVGSTSESFSVSTSVTEVTGEERHVPASLAKFQRKRSSSSGDILGRGCQARHREGGGGGGKMYSARNASTAPKSRVNSLWRDPGERSGRRSVSPVAKPSIGGQCRGISAVRANGKSSPLRVAGGEAVQGCRFGGVGVGGGKRAIAQGMVECGGSGTAIGGKESLENPLVALECFIFL